MCCDQLLLFLFGERYPTDTHVKSRCRRAPEIILGLPTLRRSTFYLSGSLRQSRSSASPSSPGTLSMTISSFQFGCSPAATELLVEGNNKSKFIVRPFTLWTLGSHNQFEAEQGLPMCLSKSSIVNPTPEEFSQQVEHVFPSTRSTTESSMNSLASKTDTLIGQPRAPHSATGSRSPAPHHQIARLVCPNNPQRQVMVLFEQRVSDFRRGAPRILSTFISQIKHKFQTFRTSLFTAVFKRSLDRTSS